MCSHPTCRSAGVKFRYCLYCKKPVTKQNFRSRHLHADLDPNHNSKMGKLVRKRSTSDTSSGKKDDADRSAKQRKLATDTKRSTRWTALLKERPAGFANMDDWISEVVFASDPKSKFAEEDALASIPEEDTKMATWNALLKERLEGDMDKAAVNKWLTRVLDASVREEEEEEPKPEAVKEEEEEAKTKAEEPTPLPAIDPAESTEPTDEQLEDVSVN